MTVKLTREQRETLIARLESVFLVAPADMHELVDEEVVPLIESWLSSAPCVMTRTECARGETL